MRDTCHDAAVDTVEWGSVERAGRRLPRLWRSVPRLGAFALVAAGFALIATADFVPWARINLGAAASFGVDATNGTDLAVTLDRVVSNESFAFQLGVIALLGAVGYTLSTALARRRVAVGLVAGVAAGNLLMIILVSRAALHTFDTLSGLGVAPRPDTAPTVSTGPGVYLAAAGVLLLVAGAVTAAGLTRLPRPVPAPRAPVEPMTVPVATGQQSGVYGPDGERELTVSPMEPLDESYFARPDNR